MISLALAGCASRAGSPWDARLTGQGPIEGSAPQLRLAVDAAGDVIIAGSLGIVKLSGLGGETLWSRAIGTSGAPRALVLARGTDPVVGGALPNADGLVLSAEHAIVRLDGASGAELWRHTARGLPSRTSSAVIALALDPLGEVIVAGFMAGNESDNFGALKLAASDGHELWRYSAREAGPGAATAVFTTPEGHAIVAGTLSNAVGGYDLALVKIDGLDGAEIWRRTVSGPRGRPAGAARAVGLQRSRDVIGAQLLSGRGGGSALIVARIDGTDGTLRWVERIEAARGSELDLAVDARDHIFAAVATPAGFEVRKLAATDGRQIWQRSFGAAGTGCGPGVVLVLDGAQDVIAAGCQGREDLALVKLRARDGRTLWERSVRIAAGPAGKTRALAVDARGDVLIARYVAPSSDRTDLVVTKLRGRDGRLPRAEPTDAPAAGAESKKHPASAAERRAQRRP